MNLLEHLDDVIDRYPNHIAVESPRAIITYSDLRLRIEEKVDVILSYGICDSCIAIAQTSQIEELISLLAILYSGNHYFIIPDINNINLSADIPIVARFEGPEFVVFEGEYVHEFVRKNWYQDIDINKRKMCVYSTSSTSGSPKFVVHCFGFIYIDTLRQINNNKYTSTDRVDLLFSNSFSASLASIFPALLIGASLIFRDDRENVGNIFDFWIESRITVTTLTSSVFRSMVRFELPKINENRVKLRFVCISGDRLEEVDVKRFFETFNSEIILQIAYASTETRTIASLEINEFNQYSPNSVGKLVSGKSVNIESSVGNNYNHGSIIVISKELALGYYEDRKLKPFPVKEGFSVFNTGDLGMFNDQNELIIKGRASKVVKIDGKWIDINFLEEKVSEFTNCNCVIMPFVDINGFDYLVAFIEGDIEFSFNEVSSFSKDLITPKFHYNIRTFPINAHGKISRTHLREHHEFALKNQEIESRSLDFFNSSINVIIKNIWKEVLGVSEIYNHSDFFKDLGGTSLSALVMITEVENQLDSNLKDIKLSDLTTFGSFVVSINRNLDFPILIQIGSVLEGRRNMIFIQNGFGDSYENILGSFVNEFNIFVLRYNQYDKDSYVKGQLFFEKMAETIDQKIGREFILIGNSFHGYIAAQIAQIRPLCKSVILLDTPFYKFSVSSVLKNKNLKNRNSIKNLFYLSLNPFKWKLVLYKVRKILKNKYMPKQEKYSDFTLSVIDIVKNNRPINKIQNLVYLFFNQSGITNNKDILDWQKVTKGNFKLVEFNIGHLDFNKPEISGQISNTIISLVREE